MSDDRWKASYDRWKTASPDDEHIPADERPEGCECHRRIGDFKWCPVHGRDPDVGLEERRERRWGRD